MWDVHAIVVVPASTAACAIRIDSGTDSGPSSIPGRMWQWRSITRTQRSGHPEG